VLSPSQRFLLAAILACLPGGCGTIGNLKGVPGPPISYAEVWLSPHGRLMCADSLDPTGPKGTCWAFGGVTESASFGKNYIIGGLTPDFDSLGKGGLFDGACMLAIGSVALAVDVPLSLVGDVVTLPVVYARQHEEPWATWWGQQAFEKSRDEERRPPVADPFAESNSPPGR
jgi:hypothetical protein